MKEYLDEIALFNHINQDKSEENNQEIDEVTDQRFLDYDFEKGSEKREKKAKCNLKKFKRGSQKKLLA